MDTFVQQLLNGLFLGSIYALIALGYTMVYGVLRFINFAHGDILMLGAFAAALITPVLNRIIPLNSFETINPGNSVLVFGGTAMVMLTAMLICAALGASIERIAYRPLRDRPRLTVLITAIGVSLFLQNITQFFFGPQPIAFPQILPNYSLTGDAAITVMSKDATVFGATLALLLLLRVVVLKTKLGLAMRALSLNPTACSLMGVNNDVVISFTFALGSALAAAAGVLVSIDSAIQPLMGNAIGIKAFVAAVLGGIGDLNGAAAGALLIGVLETFVRGVPGYSDLVDAIAPAVLIVILLFKPTGIFGVVQREKV